MNQTPIQWLDKCLRLTNYLSAAQLYLRDNFLLETELRPEHIKRRILGHWGTVPGLNLIWAVSSLMIQRHNLNIMSIVGPGHGYPAIQANLFVEGSLGEFLPDYSIDQPDRQRRKIAWYSLIRNFSWPGGFPSHSNPYTPGCILEGGELGYSLSTAFGAVFDNPDLIATCVVGDGEAETGPMATAWHSTKFLNPITSGAVLPILHLNGYKISGPTIMGTMSNDELLRLFEGYGYEPIIVEGDFLFEPTIAAFESSIQKIKDIQQKARIHGEINKPKWPMIILRSPKGWMGPESKNANMPIVGSHRSHGIPLEHPAEDDQEFTILKKWLESYRVREILQDDFALSPDIAEYLPQKSKRIGANPHARAVGSKDLILPDVAKYEAKFDTLGTVSCSSTEKFAEYMRDMFDLNSTNSNFRLFSPDETESNKLGKVFESTSRGYIWPVRSHDENISQDGRVMEMLSEHTLEGWMQGYVLTGRHGVLVTYEAFAEIISSMVDQYVKFLRHARNVSWRNPVPSLNLVLTSLLWRQDHNGFSHQNPGFISSMLNNHTDIVNVYFPVDANSMIATMQECFTVRNKVNIVVAGKRPIKQCLTLTQAKRQVSEDIMVWDFVSDENPDIVMVGCGDNVMKEIIAARQILKDAIPQIKIRIVYINQLSCFGIGDNKSRCRLNELHFDKIFSSDRPIIFNYHGYPEDIKSLIFNHHSAARFSIHGYEEMGSTTTPFDMLVKNKVDRYNLAIEALNFAAVFNSSVDSKKEEIQKNLYNTLDKHHKYIAEHGTDMSEIAD